MARLTPIKITNPNNSDYIIDETVEYLANLNTIEVRLPSLSVDEGNLVNIPIKVFTNGERLGALQIAMRFDTTLLTFKGVITEEKVGNWMSFVNPNSGVVEWGGYDVTNNEHLLDNEEQVLTLQFQALKPKSDWNTSPLYVTRKFAGNSTASDLNIKPTEGRIEVMKMNNLYKLQDEAIATILVNPNPTTGEITIQFSVPKDGQTIVALYDQSGKKIYTVIEGNIPKGIYTYKANISDFKAGMYVANLSTSDYKTYSKIILN
jgi:hypothetical protein